MGVVSSRIDSRLSDLGKIRADIVKNCGIPESSLRSIWARDSMPAADTAVKIARFLGVSVEYLITGEDEANGPKLAPDEFNLISAFRVLDERDRKNVLIFIEGLVGQYNIRGAASLCVADNVAKSDDN